MTNTAPKTAIDQLLSHQIRRGPASSADPRPTRWCLETLRGRFIELSNGPASAGLSVITPLLVEAQQHAEPIAWVTAPTSCCYPPDLAAAGVDLNAFPLVVLPKLNAVAAAKAADRLLRSAAFGLIILDLYEIGSFSLATVARLAKLAHQHDSALVCLTYKSADVPSLGSLVSLRATSQRCQSINAIGSIRFEITVDILKDKRHGAAWQQQELRHGPPGSG